VKEKRGKQRKENICKSGRRKATRGVERKKKEKKQSTKMKKEICMSGTEQVIGNGMGHWRKRRDSVESDRV